MIDGDRDASSRHRFRHAWLCSLELTNRKFLLAGPALSLGRSLFLEGNTSARQRPSVRICNVSSATRLYSPCWETVRNAHDEKVKCAATKQPGNPGDASGLQLSYDPATNQYSNPWL